MHGNAERSKEERKQTDLFNMEELLNFKQKLARK
jgi:hypothetical protein